MFFKICTGNSATRQHVSR